MKEKVLTDEQDEHEHAHLVENNPEDSKSGGIDLEFESLTAKIISHTFKCLQIQNQSYQGPKRNIFGSGMNKIYDHQNRNSSHHIEPKVEETFPKA